MAGAIGVAAALLLRSVKITCPHCGLVQRVDRTRRSVLTCARCRGRLTDPIASVATRRP
jgi:ribosomal protein L37AE/L43A